LQHRRAQCPRLRFQPRAEAGQAEKGFIDRIDFEIRGEAAQHAAAHIAVERVIARARDEAGVRETRAVQVPRRAHAMPSALASLLRAITQPSLFDSTTTGRPHNSG